MEILAKQRELNTVKPKALRREGLIPAIIFSTKSSQGKEETVPVSVELAEFKKVFAEAGESSIIEVKTDGGTAKNVLISDVQIHPLSMEPIHASFFEVDMTQEITASVPVEIINEDENPKVKSKEGILLTIISEIEVTCLPGDLPSEFEVDALQLKEVGDVLTVAEAIKVDREKIQLGVDEDEIILKLDFAVQQEEEEEEETTGVDEVGVITSEEAEARKAEGDEEGEDKPAAEEKSDE